MTYYFFITMFLIQIVSAEPAKKSLIVWDKINQNEWLNLAKWKQERKIKDSFKSADWFDKNKNIETQVGIILDKFGKCKIHSSNTPYFGSYKSKLFEGYEVEAKSNSLCMIMLTDGTLIRVSANSSVSINEFMINDKEYYFFLRINFGNVYIQSRFKEKYISKNTNESDNLLLPSSTDEARIGFSKRKSKLDFLNPLNRVNKIYKKLDNEIDINNQSLKDFKSHYLISTSFALIDCEGKISLDSYINKGKGLVTKLRDSSKFVMDPSSGKCFLKFKDKTSEKLDESQLKIVGTEDHDFRDYENSFVTVNEYLTSNIPSTYLAREYEYRFYSSIYSNEIDQVYIKKQFGVIFNNLRLKRKSFLSLRYKFLNKYSLFIEGNNFKIAMKRNIILGKYKFSDPEFFAQFYAQHFISKKFYKPFETVERLDYQKLNSTTKKLWKRIHERRINKN